ncbi:MAG TPA: PAS domain S-box protein [Tepidisphaeraceae bacterium]|nr:PAS domain S-box protein [Tepidisphaeraceae bacterium]
MCPRAAVAACVALVIAAVAITGGATPLPAQTRPATALRIGVLAYRGDEDVRRSWQPTADYLSQQVAGVRAEIVPLDFERITTAVAAGEVDFVATSPASYVELEHRYGATRIATLVAKRQGVVTQEFGGVIFCRADRGDLQGLADLKGKSFIATDANSFGGWWMAWRELKDQRIDPVRDLKPLSFGGTQDAVVEAVRDRKADAGTVRTDQLEQMAAEGKIRLNDFRILNAQHATVEFPFLRSTRLYPEWPIARLNHTPDRLAREVTVALLRMPPDSPAAVAARSAGWTIPLDYSPVHDLMRELRLGPYAHYGIISLADGSARYRMWLAIAVAMLVALVVAICYLLLLNRRLTRPEPEVSATVLAARMRAFSRVGALIVIAVGAVVLVGWALGIELLKRVVPGLIAMNPTTAVAFILAGAALLTGRAAAPGRRPGALRYVLAVPVVVIGALKLSSYLLGWDVGIDRLLFASALNAPGATGPNRMAPNTSISFVLAGCALLLLEVETRRGRRPAEWLALAGAMLALLALIGYGYGVKALFGVASFVPMALHTAATFLLLSLALLASHPDRGLMAAVNSDSAGGVLARRLLPACVLVPAILGWFRLMGERIGLYGAELGVSLYAAAMILFFVVLVWWTMGLLHRADADRRLADLALRRSEEQHRAVMEQAAEGIYLVDIDSLTVVECNAALERLLGYGHGELKGLRVYHLIDDTPAEINARLHRLLEATEPVYGERRYLRKDGSCVDVESSAGVISYGGRKLACTVVHDITERKRTQAALDAERTLLRTVIDNLPDRIYVKDAEGRYTLDNAAHQQQVGVSDARQIIGKTVRDFFSPEVAERFEQDDQAVIASRRPLFDREELTTDRDGNPRWLLTTKVPLTDADGSVRGIVGLSRDITDRKLVEEVMRESEERTRMTVETALDAFASMDADGRITGWNEQAEITFGWPREEAIGRPLAETIIPPQYRQALADDIARFEATGAGKWLNERVEITALHRDGHEFPVEMTISPLRVRETVSFNAFVHDITARKRNEREIEEKHAQLEQAIAAEREAHEQLKQAQSAMVQAEKMAGLGQMVAGVAHEINNPLAFVSNNVAVLQRDVRGLAALLKLYAQADEVIAERNAELLAEIRDLSERLDVGYTLSNVDDMLLRSRDGLKRIQQIVKDLREFARLDAGDLHDIDLNAGIESTINIVRGVAKKKQVVLDLQLSPLPPVRCYPAKINQVVMNLVTNAIDACDENGRVTVKTSAADGTVQVEVVDDGKGIPPEIRQRIFDPFFTTKKIGEGTGLGLSISYGIVRDHNGRIDVDSEPGKGTRFTVRLPRDAFPNVKKA